jgi:hypothetical protein
MDDKTYMTPAKIRQSTTRIAKLIINSAGTFIHPGQVPVVNQAIKLSYQPKLR